MRMSVVATQLIICAFLASCESLEKNESKVENPQWHNQMHRLSENHSALIELIESPTEFYNPEHYNLILVKTQEMAKAAVEVNNEATEPSANPILSYTASHFANDLTAISKLVETKQLQLAHYRLSHLPNYCISCHSRADKGATNYPVKWASSFPQKDTVSLSKALFFLSNRQYESGHAEVEKIVRNEQFVALDPKSWLSVVQKDLAILIRVEQNIQRAQGIVDAILKNKNVPSYIKSDAKVWKQSLSDWKKESQKQGTTVKDLSSVAQKLIDKSKRLPFSKNDAGFILNLRASAILNTLLETSKSSNSFSSYLYQSGQVAEALVNVDLWDLSTYYWERCIETSPATEISRVCYNQLERFVLAKSKNSIMMSTSIKDDISRLAKYRDLAHPLNPSFDKTVPKK